MNILWLQSRLFWFGFVGLVLLIVMWGSHEKAVVGATYTTAGGTYSLGWGNGTARFGHVGFSRPGYGGARPALGFSAARRDVPADVTTTNFAPAFQRDEAGVMNYVGIWVIVGLYTSAWYLSLIWLRP